MNPVRKLLPVALMVLLAGCSIVPTPLPPPSLLPVPTTEAGGPSYAHVLFVRAVEESGDTWRFEVTLHHADEDAAHFADRWEVLIPRPDGRYDRYTRPIGQPHRDEQPFTTSLSGIAIPPGVTQVRVRAHDSRDGYGGQEVTVDLAAPAGPGFQVLWLGPP